MTKEDIDYLATKLAELLTNFNKQQVDGNYHTLEARITAIEEKMSSVSDKVALRQAFTRK